jgi:hypothetical protein
LPPPEFTHDNPHGYAGQKRYAKDRNCVRSEYQLFMKKRESILYQFLENLRKCPSNI